jgi:hypothetical protein
MPIADIKAGHIRRWRKELLDANVSAVTVAKAYRLLKVILTTAADDGVIRRNPCRIKGAGREHGTHGPQLHQSRDDLPALHRRTAAPDRRRARGTRGGRTQPQARQPGTRQGDRRAIGHAAGTATEKRLVKIKKQARKVAPDLR